MIAELHNTQTNKEFQIKIAECVVYHNEIMNYAETMEIIMQQLILAQFLVTGTIICGHVFQLVSVTHSFMKFFQIIAIIIFVTLDLLFYCWYGNQITSEVWNFLIQYILLH